MQLNLDLKVPVNAKNAWAFAVDITRRQNVFKPRKPKPGEGFSFANCVISSTSHEARKYGVQVGMNYLEAKKLLPDLRILISNR